jgi:GNAT superfamily N-acetyltransferase
VTNFIVSDRRDLLQLERVHEFLTAKAYWCLGITYETVAKAAENSLCFGAYRVSVGSAISRLENTPKNTPDVTPEHILEQVGYARVVTDFSTFAWICDVYINEAARGQGLSKRLMEAILAHPQLQGLRRICLATHDAHELYKQFGFIVTKTPKNWLEIKIGKI